MFAHQNAFKTVEKAYIYIYIYISTFEGVPTGIWTENVISFWSFTVGFKKNHIKNCVPLSEVK